MDTNRPNVGVGVLVMRDGKMLLGKRKNAHGQATWAPPGGHLEFEETLEECAKRELLEETGVTAESVKKVWFTNDIYTQENKHYITIFMLVDTFSGEPENLEPHKCEGWQWFELDKLPSPLFLSVKNVLHEIDIQKHV